MKLIKPSVELIEQKSGLTGIFQQIERAGRLCYKSEDKITEDSAEKFVNMLIEKGHYAMLEHGTMYLKLPVTRENFKVWTRYSNNKYTEVTKLTKDNTECFITTNYRVLVENGWLDDLKYLCEPTLYHSKRYTFHFVTSIGITREIIRHRHMSFANESTRYCNYSKDKFGNEISYIMPYWFSDVNLQQQEAFMQICKNTEDSYTALLGAWDERKPDKRFKTGFKDNPLTPQQAREVLPMCTKSEIIVTGFESDWTDFLRLRCAKDAHPDIQYLANKVKEYFPVAIY